MLSKLPVCIQLTNKETSAVYYTVTKHDGHLRTREKCRKHEPLASVFYISRVFSNVRSVLPQWNTRLRLLHGNVAKSNKTRFFYVLYSDKTWVFDQIERAQGPIYIMKLDISTLSMNQVFNSWLARDVIIF